MKKEISSSNYIEFSSIKWIEETEKWIKDNPPEFKEGDIVFVDCFYGGDYWGAACDTKPKGIYTVVGSVKIRPNYNPVRNDKKEYAWSYVLRNDKGELEIYEPSSGMSIVKI